LNAIQWFEPLGALPIVLQLVLVHQTPFLNDGRYFSGKVAFAHFTSGNVD